MLRTAEHNAKIRAALLGRPKTPEHAAKNGQAHIRHGMYDTPTYHAWKGMKQRCTNPRSKDWPSYGGRGITIHEPWLSFEGFLADMGERPEWADGGIDRVDNGRGYEPGNCRWATRSEQQRNRRSMGGRRRAAP